MSRPYPWYYAVNDRPVMVVRTPDGGLDTLVFDWRTGGFVPDRSYVARVSETGIGKDVDSLSAPEFERLVGALRARVLARLVASPLSWQPTGDGEFPYRVVIDGAAVRIRINDFPAEPLYTVLVDAEALGDLEHWPGAWPRPTAAD